MAVRPATPARWADLERLFDPRGRWADSFACHGLLPTFEKAGFEEIARRSQTRPLGRERV